MMVLFFLSKSVGYMMLPHYGNSGTKQKCTIVLSENVLNSDLATCLSSQMCNYSYTVTCAKTCAGIHLHCSRFYHFKT